MPEAYIVDAVRTAGGRRNGALSGWHPAELAGNVLSQLVDRVGLDPAAIDDVIMGCVTQAGEQALHIGRGAVLASRLPVSVPAVSIDRQCGSSQQSLHFAAQAIMAGVQDVVIAAGVESMSRAPLGLATVPGSGLNPWSEPIVGRFGVTTFSQFGGAEAIARKHGFTRNELDALALESHLRGAAATSSGAFDTEIVPVEIRRADGKGDGGLHTADEGIRPDSTMESIGAVKLLTEDGLLTAATSSQICDGSAALMVVSKQALKDHGLTPLARVHAMAVTAGDPVIMLEEPLFATDRLLGRAGMTIDEIDLYEVNEAFASIPLAWLRHVGADPAKLNVNGGAMALGHPVGASGAKLMATLVHALRARGKRYGLQTMCEGGGVANATIIEAL
jgi:acetyl-CoA C-acetyltransferase